MTKSLLAQALTVIECVRPLELVPSASMPGVYRLGCEVRRTPVLLRELALALEEFDRTSRIGRDPTQVLALSIRYAGEHGIDVRDMADYVRTNLPGNALDARRADVDPEHEPLPGQIGAPPRRSEETVDQANIRTRTGGIRPAAKYTADALPGADMVMSEAARRMGEVTRSIGPAHRDPGLRDPAHAAGHRPAHDGADKARHHRPDPAALLLMAEFRALEARLEQVIARCGDSIQVERLRETLREVGDAVHGAASGLDGGQFVDVAMLTTVMKVSNEISAMEAEIGLEPPAPAPIMR